VSRGVVNNGRYSYCVVLLQLVVGYSVVVGRMEIAVETVVVIFVDKAVH